MCGGHFAINHKIKLSTPATESSASPCICCCLVCHYLVFTGGFEDVLHFEAVTDTLGKHRHEVVSLPRGTEVKCHSIRTLSCLLDQVTLEWYTCRDRSEGVGFNLQYNSKGHVSGSHMLSAAGFKPTTRGRGSSD